MIEENLPHDHLSKAQVESLLKEFLIITAKEGKNLEMSSKDKPNYNYLILLMSHPKCPI